MPNSVKSVACSVFPSARLVILAQHCGEHYSSKNTQEQIRDAVMRSRAVMGSVVHSVLLVLLGL